ncbi:DUF3180 domain-containing protein [Jatrophihabitans telluris]|uniref:DUF3180 domain-containing protein n=1 Tax=Jatrophihabitans telluris TaxID=2038343 RepID=A0ABY4R005_9ACTN|nr:DUF3180 domain-containing protein [Jatrophihabitans telluris]UQX88918.1 DUF3180 domain-containing protein [Jatrophihabitans telluris]
MMRRTSATDLLVPFLVVAALGYLILQLSYGSLPPFQWYAAVPIGALAAVEIVLAPRVRSAVRHDPQAKPMTAIAIARSVALGKASSLCGAALTGAASALVAKVVPDVSRTSAASHDVRVGIVVLLASVALTLTGLWLERAGIDPNSDRG